VIPGVAVATADRLSVFRGQRMVVFRVLEESKVVKKGVKVRRAAWCGKGAWLRTKAKWLEGRAGEHRLLVAGSNGSSRVRFGW
jgi:hypothetical protein